MAELYSIARWYTLGYFGAIEDKAAMNLYVQVSM